MLGTKHLRALLLVGIMCLAPLSGCFGEDGGDGPPSMNDVVITPEVLTGGVFQGLTISAERDVSAFIPYLIKDVSSGFVFNSTVVDLRQGDSVQLNVLAPPRTDAASSLLVNLAEIIGLLEKSMNLGQLGSLKRVTSADVVLVMSIGREHYHIESVAKKLVGLLSPSYHSISTRSLQHISEEEGAHSTGVVNGRTTYNYLNHLTDQTPDPSDLSDGAVGYLEPVGWSRQCCLRGLVRFTYQDIGIVWLGSCHSAL